MRRILSLIICTFMLLRVSAQVTLSITAPDPQSGLYNYFGVRATLAETMENDVVVTGYIFDNGLQNTNTPFTLTIPAGYLTAETANNYYQTDPTATGDASIGTITIVYAGQNVKYLADECILQFESDSAMLAVIESLNGSYESYNAAYDAQYSELDEDELDDMDDENEFDEFKPYRDFEKLFNCFQSMRSIIEGVEDYWLYNSFTGPDPDSLDLCYDDGENAIFNSSYSVKIRDSVLQLTPSGLYINSVYQDLDGSEASIRTINPIIDFAGPNTFDNKVDFANCKYNRSSKSQMISMGSNRYYRLKVAINSIYVLTSIKGKVSSYKLKNGRYKRARTEMGVRVDGIVQTNAVCTGTEYKEKNKPYTIGTFEKRKSLKARVGDFGRTWRAFNGDVVVTIYRPGNLSDYFALVW